MSLLAEIGKVLLVLCFCLVTRSYGFQYKNQQDVLSESSPSHAEMEMGRLTFDNLDDFRVHYKLPALAAASSRERLFESDVTGYRRTLATVMAEPDDQFHLGSLTKAMTSTLLALLVKDGLFSWNSTLGELLPDLEMDPAHRNTTLATVTSHRAGISIDLDSDRALFSSLYDDNLPVVKGRWLLLEKALLNPPALPKGTFKYENLDFVIAGSIIDIYSGMPWESFIRERLFRPLGMKNCGFGPNDETNAISIDNPWPHKSSILGPLPLLVPFKYRDNPRPLSSSGTAHCPILEYGKFLQLHVDAVSGLKNPLGLSHSDVTFLHTPLYVDDGEKFSYTPGAWLRDVKSLSGGEYILTHQGSNNYNLAQSWLVIPEAGVGQVYVAMTNVGDAADGIHDVIKSMCGPRCAEKAHD